MSGLLGDNQQQQPSTVKHQVPQDSTTSTPSSTPAAPDVVSTVTQAPKVSVEGSTGDPNKNTAADSTTVKAEGSAGSAAKGTVDLFLNSF